MAYPGGMHRVWAIRRAWRVRLLLSVGLALLLLPLGLLAHPAWVLASLLGLLYPSRWEEPRALAELDRRYGLAYRSALEAPVHHPWRSQLQAEAEASLRGARPPNWPWVPALAYLALVGMAWVFPPLQLVTSPVATSSPPPSAAPQTPLIDPAQPGSGRTEPPPLQGDLPKSQQPSGESGDDPEIQPALPSQEAQNRPDAQGQPEAIGEDANRPLPPGQNLQGPERQAPQPDGQNPLQSQQNPLTDRNQPGPTGQTQNGQPESNRPGQDPQSPQPGQAQPTQPGQAQPAQPGQAEPVQMDRPSLGQPQPSPGQPVPDSSQPSQPGQPGRAQPPPTQPGQAQPTQPGQVQPAQPGQTQPTQPGQRSSGQPGQAQPGQGQPAVAEPGQGAGQSRSGKGTEGQGQQARPPLSPSVDAQRPAGEAPLSRGENRQGRPLPLPSPWPSGQPPQNVQRQAEKYLESEPLPPEVRELLRRYFELPP